MKRFYLLALSCLALSSAGAQVGVPRPKASGVNISLCPSHYPVPDTLKTAARPRPAGQAPRSARALRAVKDSTFGVSRIREVDGRITQQDNITYDTYGLRQLVTHYDADSVDSPTRRMRYTYELNDDAYWTKRVIETDYRPEGYEDAGPREWWVNSTVRRNLDSLGRITMLENDDPRARWYRRLRYDYSHLVDAGYGRPPQPALVDIDEWRDGQLVQRTVFRWHEAAQQFLTTYFQMGNQCRISEHFDDYVETIWWSRDAKDTTVWEKKGKYTDYYRVDGHPCKGSMMDLFDDSPSGDRTITITEGDSVTRLNQYFEWRGRYWRNFMKFVERGDYLESPYYSYTVYGYDNDRIHLSNRTVVTEIHQSPKVTLYLSAYYDAYTGITDTTYYANIYLNEWYPSTQKWERVDETTFVFRTTEEGNDVFTYYDMDGSVKTCYMLKKGINSPVGQSESESDIFTMYVRQDDGTWQQSREFEYPAGSTTVRHICNDQGYPERIIVYTDNPDTPTREQRYTYTPKGYTEEICEEGQLTAKNVFELTDNDWICHSSYAYDGEGNIYSARRIDDKKGGSRTYTWDGESFILDRVTARELSYRDENRARVTEKYVVEGDDVVPSVKTVDSNQQYGFLWEKRNLNYHWDRAAREWVGDSGSVDYGRRLDFALDYGSGDFINHYDDGKDDIDGTETSAEDNRLLEAYTAICVWNPDTKSFEDTCKQGTQVSIDGDEATVLHLNGTPVAAERYERDADGRIISHTHYPMDAAANMLPADRTITYTYSPEGYMLTREEKAACHTTLDTYTYERRTITVTGIDELQPDATAELTIDGLSVSAPGQPLSLYDLQGARVAAGTGSVTAPRPGLYIIKVGQASAKVMLR